MTRRGESQESLAPTGLGPLVILDTNVWISECMLTSWKARELVGIVSRLGGLIGLPAIVKREILAVVPRDVRSNLEKANGHMALAVAVLDQKLGVQIPEADHIRTAVHRRLEVDLGDLIEDMPHTLELVDAAMARVIDRMPPNGEKNEQFRDSLILETAVAAGLHRDVHLVTEDGGFFVERKREKGPSTEVSQDIRRRQSSLRLYGDVVACAKALNPLAPEIGQARAAARIAELIRADVQTAAGKKLFAAGARRVDRFDVVPTTQRGTVFVAFVLTYALEPLPDAAELGRGDAQLQAEGSCYYDYQRARVIVWNLDEIRLSWYDVDGAPRRATVKYASASISASAAVFKDGE